MPTEAARRALANLRDGSQFDWHVIPLLALVLYVYANEVERRNWSVVFAGLAVWGMDWLNEIANAVIFHATGYAPLWGFFVVGFWVDLAGCDRRGTGRASCPSAGARDAQAAGGAARALPASRLRSGGAHLQSVAPGRVMH